MRKELLEKLKTVSLTPAWLAISPGRDVGNRIVLSSTGVLKNKYTLADVANKRFYGCALLHLERDLDTLQDITEEEIGSQMCPVLTFRREKTNMGRVIMTVKVTPSGSLDIVETWNKGTHVKLIDSSGIVREKTFFNEHGTIIKKEHRRGGIHELCEGLISSEKTYDPETAIVTLRSSHMHILKKDPNSQRPSLIEIIERLDYKEVNKRQFKVSFAPNGKYGLVQRMTEISDDKEKKSMCFYYSTGQLIANSTDLMGKVKINYFRSNEGNFVMNRKEMANGTVEQYHIHFDGDTINRVKKVVKMPNGGKPKTFLLFKLNDTE